jgi:branched-chain amino acid transport system substrate-binding protein
MKKLLTCLLVLLSSSLLLTACGKKSEESTSEGTSAAAPAAEGPILIGVAGAHSGDLASYGLPTANAAKLYVEEVNKRGGINGRLVQLVIEDDACKPELATNTANKLVSSKVVAVVGHICSGATKAALGIYADAKIPVISPSATSPELTQGGQYPNFFRTIAPDDAQARLEADFALDKLNLKKFAVLHDKGDYGKGITDFVRAFLDERKADGVEVVLYEGITPGAVDYSAVVQKIGRSGAEAVIFGGYHPEASKIVPQLRRRQITAPFISNDGVKEENFIRVAGEFAEGVYATGPKDTSSNEYYAKVTEEHKNAFQAEPGSFYYNGYAAIVALVNAIEKAGSTDFDAITNALKTEYIETPLGNISFDSKGDAIGVGFSVYQVQGGKFVEIQ